MNTTMRTHRSRLIGPFVIIGLAPLCGIGSVQAEPTSLYSPADLKALERGFTDLAEKVRPMVAAVRGYQAHSPKEVEGKVMIPISQGSGFVIGSEGFILTNGHVIETADRISVTVADGRQFDATVVQRDERSDLAVLKIDADDLVVAHWGDATKLRVNQWVFACGNPFGLANRDGRASVTYGVVSALGREMTDRIAEDARRHYYGNLIETSAAINPGSSGGPLVNVDGEVVGIVTAIQTSSGVNEGMGFAIPIDANTRRIIETLKSGQAVRYGFLGVSVDDVPQPTSRRVAEARRSRGARITSVSPSNGPAGRAGLRPDDIVLEFNGVAIEGKDHLVRVVGFTPVGTEATVKYLRRQVEHRTTLTVGDRLELLAIDSRP